MVFEIFKYLRSPRFYDKVPNFRSLFTIIKITSVILNIFICILFWAEANVKDYKYSRQPIFLEPDFLNPLEYSNLVIVLPPILQKQHIAANKIT